MLFPPHTLSEYALLADGERGALVGPRGDIAFMCAPRWHDDAVFSALLGGRGCYAVTPLDPRYVWGGYYEPDTLIWRSRWVTTDSVVESRDALAFPGGTGRLVLLRRVEAQWGEARVRVALECRAGFGEQPMNLRRHGDVWEGRTGSLRLRWSGAADARLEDGELVLDVTVSEGRHHDLVLELSEAALAADVPDADRAWAATERAWAGAVPRLGGSAAPGDARHSYAVLRGLTSSTGAMVAAATTALPERAEQGRNYDYRYAWIRDQCFAGQAAAVVGGHDLLDAAVRFVTERVHEDGARLLPAYTVTGERVPDERRLTLPGYPGAPTQVGNHAGEQFQLDAFGESLLLLASADRAGRLDADGWRAVETLVDAIEKRGDEPDGGIWELAERRWAHSRLMCAAGLRAVAGRRSGPVAPAWLELADALVDSVDRDCLHPDGRWQRAPDDPRVDAALLLPGIRGAVPPDDPRHVRTWRAVIADLADDGFVYRFRHGDAPLHRAEGAFVLSGFHLAQACLGQGQVDQALRWFERNRGALGPAGLFAEEYDVVQRQLRGNLPQAFAHAALMETAHELGRAGVGADGFDAEER
ncbi:glycoside hydrolase family 15 protein [Nocardioides panacihumi]|uniref:Glycoside hydrolase family 15 protein n=1 Tax=Nocardioides panacihumi TaxID=400774 RepID=A0ABN2RYC6_9ACTN